jgi:hypothetical protein
MDKSGERKIIEMKQIFLLLKMDDCYFGDTEREELECEIEDQAMEIQKLNDMCDSLQAEIYDMKLEQERTFDELKTEFLETTVKKVLGILKDKTVNEVLSVLKEKRRERLRKRRSKSSKRTHQVVKLY